MNEGGCGGSALVFFDGHHGRRRRGDYDSLMREMHFQLYYEWIGRKIGIFIIALRCTKFFWMMMTKMDYCSATVVGREQKILTLCTIMSKGVYLCVQISHYYLSNHPYRPTKTTTCSSMRCWLIFFFFTVSSSTVSVNKYLDSHTKNSTQCWWTTTRHDRKTDITQEIVQRGQIASGLGIIYFPCLCVDSCAFLLSCPENLEITKISRR